MVAIEVIRRHFTAGKNNFDTILSPSLGEVAHSAGEGEPGLKDIPVA